MTRRELLALAAGTALAQAQTAPSSPVSVAKCSSYNEDITAIVSNMFDQLGGAAKLVANKTVTIKLNLTGSPGLRFQGKPLGSTHYTHPKTIGTMLNILDRAGAKRIRLVESAWGTAGPLEEYMLDSGWNVRAFKTAAKSVEFVNTNGLGNTAKKYARVKVPHGAMIFPSYDVHPAFAETDVFMSMAKLKNHGTCGVTLSMKNCFGNTPASIYGDDAGIHEPNESPTKGRLDVCHFGKRQPASVAAAELNPQSSREPTYRMPRITAELVSARPIDIAFIDGIETLAQGEGPWIKGIRAVQPGVLILGTNGVTTDTVAAAVMGYDPRAPKGTAPFQQCDNTLLLAESLGVGSADLRRIEVVGTPISQARYNFG